MQNDKYDGDDDERVNPITSALDVWTDFQTKEVEQPEHNLGDSVTPIIIANENHPCVSHGW